MNTPVSVTYDNKEKNECKTTGCLVWNQQNYLLLSAFAAAERAREVYACEPVDCLREYLRDKIRREKIRNMRVVDGMADSLAYPDNTFDIVMSGHVVGDNYDAEIAEIFRVVKSGGWILDCPGEESRRCESNRELLKRGFEEFHYSSSLGGDVYRYRKQVFKDI